MIKIKMGAHRGGICNLYKIVRFTGPTFTWIWRDDYREGPFRKEGKGGPFALTSRHSISGAMCHRNSPVPIHRLIAGLRIGSLSLQHIIPTKGHLHFYFAIHHIRSCLWLSLWLKQNIPISFFSSLQVERCIKWEHNVTVETFIFPRKQSSGSGTDRYFSLMLEGKSRTD